MNRITTAFLLCTTVLTLSSCRSREGVPNSMADNNVPVFSLHQSGSASGTTVVVKDDETVYSIAYAHGITTAALIAINDLQPPYVLKPGQVLQLPNPGEHIVRNGESLESIASMYGISSMVLAQENHLDMASPLQRRQRLIIPSKDTKPFVAEAMAAAAGTPMIAAKKLDPVGGISDKPTTFAGAPMGVGVTNELPSELANELAREKGVVPLAEPAKKEAKELPPVKASKPINTIAPVPSVPPVAEAPAKTPKAEPSSTKPLAKKEKPVPQASPGFIWPVKGKTLAKFGQKTAKGKNDGLNIAAPMGSSVKAAADGTVVYAGSELKGFGNLVLIKHADGFVTAYGYNSTLLVKKGQAIKQGQEIAKVGKTGDANEPQLHFEVRKGTQPIDPMTKLGS